MDEIIAPIVDGAFNLIGQDMQNKANKNLARYAFNLNESSIDKQNLYNTPTNQMLRLKAAGLNPNLIYGNGSSSAGNQESAAEYKAPEMKINGNLGIQDKISQYQNQKLTAAQTDNVTANTANTQAETANKTLTAGILTKKAQELGINIEQLLAMNPIQREQAALELTNKKETYPIAQAQQRLDLKQKRKIYPYQADIARTDRDASAVNLNRAKQGLTSDQIKNQLLRLDVSGKRTENDIKLQNLIFEKWRSQLTEIGATTSDNLLVRKIAEYFKQKGVSPESPEAGKWFYELLNSITPEGWDKSREKAIQNEKKN